MISKELTLALVGLALDILRGRMTHPVDIARRLETLTENAWLEAFEFYPPSVRIE